MTDRERKFCLEYLKTGNGSQAARSAGYAAGSARQTANRLLTKEYISDFIEERRAEDDASMIADGREIKRHLTSTMRDKEAKNRDRLRAAELLAKLEGLFEERIAVQQVEPAKPRVVVYLPEIERDDEDEE